MLILVCLEADLKHPIAQCVTIERLYGQHSLLIVGHGDKPEAFAFVALQIAYNLQHVAKIKSKKAIFQLDSFTHLNRLHSAEGSKELPQHILLGLGCQIVHKDAPTRAGYGISLYHAVGNQITCQRRIARDHRAAEGRELMLECIKKRALYIE